MMHRNGRTLLIEQITRARTYLGAVTPERDIQELRGMTLTQLTKEAATVALAMELKIKTDAAESISSQLERAQKDNIATCK